MATAVARVPREMAVGPEVPKSVRVIKPGCRTQRAGNTRRDRPYPGPWAVEE